MPRSSVLSPLVSKLMCMCAGYGGRNHSGVDEQQHEAVRSPTNLAEKTLLKNPVSKHSEAQKAGREVHIDKTTAIPMELYWDMMRQGDRAKNGGQHKLEGLRSGKPHLVLSTGNSR